MAAVRAGVAQLPDQRVELQRGVDVLAVGTFGRGVAALYDVTSYFKQATVLQFGLANNDSQPDASYLIDGTNLDGTTFVRPLNKYGTGTLTIAGAASYTGGTTIFGGTMMLGNGGAGGLHPRQRGVLQRRNESALRYQHQQGARLQPVGQLHVRRHISGPGQVFQIGSGTTILSGASTYTGPTFVDSGTLAVNGSITSLVTVNSGGTLAGTGSVGSTSVAAGGVLQPGYGGAGTLKSPVISVQPGQSLSPWHRNQHDRERHGDAGRHHRAAVHAQRQCEQELHPARGRQPAHHAV